MVAWKEDPRLPREKSTLLSASGLFELNVPAMVHLSRDKEMDAGMMSRMKLVGEAVEGEEILS